MAASLIKQGNNFKSTIITFCRNFFLKIINLYELTQLLFSTTVLHKIYNKISLICNSKTN